MKVSQVSWMTTYAYPWNSTRQGAGEHGRPKRGLVLLSTGKRGDGLLGSLVDAEVEASPDSVANSM